MNGKKTQRSKSRRWISIGFRRHLLRCPRCRKTNGFKIVQEPVARKVHKRRSHRLRVVAICGNRRCAYVTRITRGPAN